ncbi:hypothetical protein FBUS_00868 [Fasciolopsis buskii]|uniref:Uncharacterized protein n=1 Tax=Fasciolopsis buskii TaxID=27845 RepID=A0A8E0RVG1_9TREM|nr:hypothetical protein FBUS_00868 [Fasciolopsis buski]
MFLFGFTFSSVPIAHRILSKTTDPNHSDDPISARQEFLAKHGLCDLIIRCMSDPKIDEATYLKVTEVGNNLLVGGNRFVQTQFYNALSGRRDYQEFFSLLFRRLHGAQTQLDSYAGVKLSSLSSKPTRNPWVRLDGDKKFDENESVSTCALELVNSLTGPLKFMRALCACHYEPFQASQT